MVIASQARPFFLRDTEDMEPWSYYDEVRQRGPLVWDEAFGAWVVFGFDECATIETHEERFRSPYHDAPEIVVQIKGGGRNIAILGGEEHVRMRRFFFKLMSPTLVETYQQAHIRPIIATMLDRILAKGTGKADLAAEFADHIPPRVIAALLGMPWEDDALIARILDLHEQMMEVIGAGFATEELREKGLKASADINAMLLPYIRDRRANPQNDLISRVWLEAPADYGADLTEEDAVAICRELFLGGADTTVHGIANVLYLVLTDPAIRQKLDGDREALKATVEEAMRLYGSVMYRFRIAAGDDVVGGTAIRKGERLILLHSAANRDPAKYACPHQADITRRPAADHLTFNKGPRSCVGMGLARAEMRDALTEILDRLPNVRLDPSAEPPRFRGLFMRSWRSLNVVFDA